MICLITSFLLFEIVEVAHIMNNGMSILYVEDNLENQILILRILNAEGYSVTFAENATQALAAVSDQNFDLILMDINLPDIDGYTLTATLRENPMLTGVPIIALTANVMRGDREKSLEAGCDGYIQKPVDVDALPNQVEMYLKR
jgi:two-component system cell cycle response regulator DivK